MITLQENIEKESQSSEALIAKEVEGLKPALDKDSQSQSNFAQTIGFFSGGEVGSEGFKSLRSQLS